VIAELDAELGVLAGDMNAAQQVRELEHDAFVTLPRPAPRH
jgi:hypothetical protein